MAAAEEAEEEAEEEEAADEEERYIEIATAGKWVKPSKVHRKTNAIPKTR